MESVSFIVFSPHLPTLRVEAIHSVLPFIWDRKKLEKVIFSLDELHHFKRIVLRTQVLLLLLKLPLSLIVEPCDCSVVYKNSFPQLTHLHNRLVVPGNHNDSFLPELIIPLQLLPLHEALEYSPVIHEDFIEPAVIAS